MKLNEIAKGFRWRTMEGEIMTLGEMETRHCFNSLKMIFNHVAEAYNLPTVWFTHKYDEYCFYAKSIPKSLLKNMAVFLYEIENRDDLPDKYAEPYAHIKNVLKSAVLKEYKINLLP